MRVITCQTLKLLLQLLPYILQVTASIEPGVILVNKIPEFSQCFRDLSLIKRELNTKVPAQKEILKVIHLSKLYFSKELSALKSPNPVSGTSQEPASFTCHPIPL